MPHTLLVKRLATTLCLVAVVSACACQSNAQQPNTQQPNTQQLGPTAPPANARPILTLHAVGSQYYTCQQSGQSYAWVFTAPAARLFDDSGKEVATHGDGPVWNFQDGTWVHGAVLKSSPAPTPGNIPWLLLKATNPSGTGIASRIDFIRRSDTQGGIAPTTACDATHAGELTRIPYTAAYTFYSTNP